ncbi:hypothetical protein BDV38DRAFT_283154 [Aspergillus pseudotamarii]|uniref:DUF7053 domain-containing protein n=1 Tax=Aspergillus pseudotamarii TaxID=132259 RepID=A0A5N6SRK5_ASPPS|nr:uncharacterized protein BDV38DRAFT_283154 [Aspergillus pseudotamarii]KAE8137316.1 hypothetical protein BDV38DRAFT_283154 [Aspergillus pseudotamarii]
MSSYFYTNVDRGAKHYQIPHSLSLDQTIEILHNHRLLAEQIWPSMTVKVIYGNVAATTVAVKSATLEFKATFTNLDNGVSLQEKVVMGFGVQVQWTVVDRYSHGVSSAVRFRGEGMHSGALLEENVRASCLRVVDRFLKFADDFNPKTKFVIEVLEKVARGEISMDDIEIMNRGYGDTERLKEE